MLKKINIKILVSVLLSIVVITIGVTTVIIKNSKTKSDNIIEEQNNELQVLEEQKEKIEEKIESVDDEIEKKEQELNNENSDKTQISEQIDKLKSQKQQLEDKKQEIIEKKNETIQVQESNTAITNKPNNNQENPSENITNNSQNNHTTNETANEQKYTINISTTSVSLEVGEKANVNVTFTNPNVTYLSSSIMEKNNNDVIYMDSTIISDSQYIVNIIGKKIGTAQIEITEKNTPNVIRIINVTVKPQTLPSGISLDKSNVEITYGQNRVVGIGAHITPENAKNRNIIWKSSNENVAKPNFYKGKDDTACTVIPVGGGTCIFTATTEEGGYSASCVIVINTIAVTGIRMDTTVKTYGYIGDSIQLNWYVDPYNATNRKVNWISKDTSIATVDANGKVTFHSVGMTDIIATTDEGGYKGLIVVQCIPSY